MRADELQVVIRTNEYCERCGAKNPFRKQRTVIDPSGGKMQYAKCRECGALVKIYWSDRND